MDGEEFFDRLYSRFYIPFPCHVVLRDFGQGFASEVDCQDRFGRSFDANQFTDSGGHRIDKLNFPGARQPRQSAPIEGFANSARRCAANTPFNSLQTIGRGAPLRRSAKHQEREGCNPPSCSTFAKKRGRDSPPASRRVSFELESRKSFLERTGSAAGRN